MPDVAASNIGETTTDGGTGSLNLGGAIDESWQTFSGDPDISDGDKVVVSIFNQDTKSEWEIVEATYDGVNGNIDRPSDDDVYKSSNANNRVNFTASDTKHIEVAQPGEGAVWQGVLTFGTGRDGDVTISANTTLQEDKHYRNLTVEAGVVLDTNGYRVFVQDTMTNNGTIRNNGTAGGDGEGNSSGNDPGTAGTGAAGGTLAAGVDGVQGSGTNESSSPDGVDGIDKDPSLGKNGAAGGDGGAAATSSTGGAGGTATPEQPEAVPNLRQTQDGVEELLRFVLIFEGGRSGSSMSPSAGSGSGGAGGNTDDFDNCWAATGGGSGGGGGIVHIAARVIDNGSGVIEANGGDGGDGGDAPGCGTMGGAGGGGGGPGGILVLIYAALLSGTEQALGGTGGAGGSGSGGDPGSPGQDGPSGRVYKIAA